MNVLSVTNARKSFGAVKALDGASLDLREGGAAGAAGPERRRENHADPGDCRPGAPRLG